MQTSDVVRRLGLGICPSTSHSHNHTQCLSRVLVVVMKTKELKTKISLTHSRFSLVITHSHTLTITCTCCYDERKEFKTKIYSHAHSLILSRRFSSLLILETTQKPRYQIHCDNWPFIAITRTAISFSRCFWWTLSLIVPSVLDRCCLIGAVCDRTHPRQHCTNQACTSSEAQSEAPQLVIFSLHAVDREVQMPCVSKCPVCLNALCV